MVTNYYLYQCDGDFILIACLYGFLTFFSLPQEENKLFLLHYMWVFVEYLYLLRSMYEDDEYQLFFIWRWFDDSDKRFSDQTKKILFQVGM